MKVKDKIFKCELRLLLGGSSRNAKPTTNFALISNPFRPSCASYFEIRQKDFNQKLKPGFILRYFDAKVNYSFLNYFFPSYSRTCFNCSRTLSANGLDIHKKLKDLFRPVIQIQRESMDLC